MTYVKRKYNSSVLALGIMLVALLALSAGVAAESGSQTAPGLIWFEVTVEYDDGGGTQTETDGVSITVIQVRAWELTHDGYPDVVHKRPDSETEFDAMLHNLGNYDDDFELGYEWHDGTDWTTGPLPDGWSIEILAGGVEVSGPITIGPGASEQLMLRIFADETVADGERLEARLVVTTPETDPDIPGLTDLPTLPGLSDETDSMVVRIVEHLITFELTPDQVEVEPRDTFTVEGVIENPSWANVPGGFQVVIEVPVEFPVDRTSLDNWNSTPEAQEYGCGYVFDEDQNVITITCSNPFPGTEDPNGPGELPLSFDVTVNPYTPPTDSETEYVFPGELEYTDLAGTDHTIEAISGVGGQTVPKVIVLTVREVRIYLNEDGTFDPGDLSKEIISNPGKTVTLNVWVRNEGNVADEYILTIFDQVAAAQFSWVITCDTAASTGLLAPGTQQPCVAELVIPDGTEDDDEADSLIFRPVSTEEPGHVESNDLSITLHIHAPTIEVKISVWMDPEHKVAATQVKPGDTVYILMLVENKGRLAATDLTVTHNIPAAIELLAGSVSAAVGTDAKVVNLTTNGFKVGPELDLAPGKILKVTYQGTVK